MIFNSHSNHFQNQKKSYGVDWDWRRVETQFRNLRQVRLLELLATSTGPLSSKG